MSAEYAARMEVLQRQRQELTAQREAIQKRMALREATAAEFSAVALQSCRQKWKTQRSAALAAKKRNEEFVRSLHETQRQVHVSWSRLQSDQSGSSALLAQEEARYNRKVEQVYPAWQEQLQRQRVQKLRELEDKKRAVERRRYLAKKSFDKEQTLGDLIRKTRHEVEMAENLEQNEVYERELLRTQSSNQAKEVDQSIREVALEARSFLQQQAERHFEVMPELDEELADKLSETFSPRKTLRALREGGSSFSFEENQQYEEEKPVRQIRVEIPARMNTPARPYYPDEPQQERNQAYAADEAFEDAYIDKFPREFVERPRHYNAAASEGEQMPTTASAADDYTNLKQKFHTHQPEMVQHTQVLHAGGAPSPSVFAGSEAHRQATTPQHARGEELPTLITGKLDPIPEVNESSPWGATSPMDPDNIQARGFEADTFRDQENAGSDASVSVPFPASTASRANTPGPSASVSSMKVEANRAASSAAAPAVSPTPANATVIAQVEERQPCEYQENPVPRALLSREALPEPARASMPDPNEAIRPSASLTEGGLQVSTRMLVQESLGGSCREEPAKAPLLDISSSTSEEDDAALHAGSVSAPSEAGAERTIAKTDTPPVLEVEAAASASVDTNQRVNIEAPSGGDVKDGHESEQSSSSHDAPSKTDSLRVLPRVDTMAASPSTTDTFALETAESPEAETTADAAAKASAEPSPSFSYSPDLVEPLSPPTLSPAHVQSSEDDMLLTSMQSDDFELSTTTIQPVLEAKPSVGNKTAENADAGAVEDPKENDSSVSKPPSPAPSAASITEKLSPVDRVKALGALISRVEEGAAEGDALGGPVDTGSSNESKRELLKMAVGGRKAQIAFFGSDICFELILDMSRDLGPVLFPPKAFEGIMNDQKIRKLHQSNKDKQLDLWKALSGFLKQLVQLKAIPSATLVESLASAFLAHDPDNQRSQRKLREFLATLCGGGGSKPPSPRKETSTASPPPSPPKQDHRSPSPEPAKPAGSESKMGTPQLLRTAFLQRKSPPKPKVFGIASSSFKDRSSESSDVLKSMSSGPMKLSQKLMRGGKMNDYSEFEEEEEVDLQNLIGSRPTFASAPSAALGRAARTTPTGKASRANKAAVEEEDDDEFDADF